MNEQQIFVKVLAESNPADRLTCLDQACGTDAELRQRVEVLLQAHERAGQFLESPAAGPDPTSAFPPLRERPGTEIGPYKLLQQIGEGGMGVVYMAEQSEPIARRVALKIIKPGMDTRQVIARFEAERQALALMDHVNIARVLDAGTTEQGRPYFVMELVHGVPITRYCDDNHLTPRERLELFVPVCQAIQHAHQKGIIHRDIKPSNVMVTLYDGQPVPKVIDFGVAKATEQRLTERTLFTQYGTMVGTLEYMSPEQAEMSALGVDTRSDIYSLGVLLYELLTGSTPLDRKRMREAAFGEILRIIKEEEPPKPSTRLSDSGEALASISANRHTEPAKLTKLVRGELDWIVMKALEKDRNRRYETANGFALDVQRYLSDEPVQACPPSPGYRLRKFACRNTRALLTTGIVALAVLFGVGTLGWAVRDRAARREDAAKQEAARQTKLDEEVTRALEEAEKTFKGDKLTEAMSAVKRAEGLLASGGGSEELRQRVRRWRTELEMAIRLEEIRLGQTPDPVNLSDRAVATTSYRVAFREYGLDLETIDPDEAAQRIRASRIKDHFVAALDDWAQSASARNSDMQRLLTIARRADSDPWRGQLREALLRGDRKTVEGLACEKGIESQPAATVVLLADVLKRHREISLANNVLRQAYQRHPGDLWINVQLAAICTIEGSPARRGEAVGFLRAAVALRPEAALVRTNLGGALVNHGDLAEAEAVFSEVVRLQPDEPSHHMRLGYTRARQHKLADAEAAFRMAIRLKPDAFNAFIDLAGVLFDQGKMQEAETTCREAVRLQPKVARAHFNLGIIRARLGRWDEAAAEFTQALELDPAYHFHWFVAAPLNLNRGDLDAYRQVCREMLERFGNTDQPEIAERTAKTCLLIPDPDDLERAVKLAEWATTGTEKHRFYWYFMMTRGLAEYRADRPAAAVEWLKRCQPLATGEPARVATWAPLDATVLAVLAMAHHRLGQAEDAGAALAKSRALVAENLPDPAQGRPFGSNWHEWLRCQVLLREAEGVLESDKTGEKSHNSLPKATVRPQ